MEFAEKPLPPCAARLIDCATTTVLALALTQAGGCATAQPAPVAKSHRVGEVGAVDITRRLAMPSRMKLADNEGFEMPLAQRSNALPVYPEALLAQQLPPQRLCLRVAIDARGRVMGSAPMVATPECPALGVVDPAFLAAARQAVAGWHFDPASRCTFADGKLADANTCVGADRKVGQAVSLAYRFVFEQHDGRGSVRISH